MLVVKKRRFMAKDKINFTERIWGTNDNKTEEEWGSLEGQLAIDSYQTDSEIIIKAPVAGVSPEDVEITFNDDVITIKGQRQEEKRTEKEDYFLQEVYWGGFSRSYILPVAIDIDKAQAIIKDGLLTVRLPKAEKARTKSIKVKAG